MATSARSVLRFRLLGPLEVVRDGEPLPLGGERQRGLLAFLLLHANELVSTEQLAEQLFGTDASESSIRAVRVAVSRLRRLLDDETLATAPGGYVVRAEPGQLDVAEFEALVAEGRAALNGGDPAAAATSLGHALALHRGPPLADLASLDFLQPEARRLEELRLSALMDRIDADLALGSGPALVPELEGLVQANPFQERLRGQLMLALYRSGRQADALEVYRLTRGLLADELGLEPSRALQQLERAILRHDESLDPAEPAEAPVDERPTLTRRRRRWLWLVAAATVVAAALAAAVFDTAGAHRSLPSAPTRPVPLGHRVLAEIPVSLPACCAFGFGRVWAVGHHDGMLREIDSGTNRVVGKYKVVDFPGLPPLAAVGSLWLPSGDGKLVRFDPVRRHVVHRFATTAGEQIAWGYGSIWVTSRHHRLVRIDYRRNKIVHSLKLASGANDFDDGITIGYGSVWVTLTDRSTLLKIDPTTMKVVDTIHGLGDSYGWMPLTAGDGSIWIYHVAGSHGRVFRVDPYTDKVVKRIPVGRPNVAWPNGGILDAGGYVWSCDAGNTLSKIDPRTNRVVGWYSLPDEVCSEVTFGDGSIWLSLYDHSLIYRIDPS